MRPDEHKKKRSAQYNKKKGNKDDKKENKPSEGKGKGLGDPKNRPPVSNVSDLKQQQQQRPQNQSAFGGSNFKSSQYTDRTSSSEDEVVERSHTRQKQKFKRRDIVSNWTRYEITETDPATDVIDTPAVDYSKLLSQSGNASSHFRFKDEADWEEITACGGDSDQTVPVLGIKLTSLGSSLQCLPMFERLGLSADLFPQEQREQLIQAANKHREEYLKTQSSATGMQKGEIIPTGQSVWVDDSNSEVEPRLQPTEPFWRESNALSSSLIHTKTTKSPKNEQTGQSEEQIEYVESEVPISSVLSDDVCNKSKTVTDNAMGVTHSDQILVSAEQEEELDFLLSMDTVTSGVTQTCNTDRSNCQPTEESKPSQPDIATEPQSLQYSIPPAQTSDITLSTEKPKTGNLEDWLDSILED